MNGAIAPRILNETRLAAMVPIVCIGDLLEQPVDVIVNAWNRNIIPWWLLLPSGVSGAIKKKAGYAPFYELGRLGQIPLGGAVFTSAGHLPYQGIIHVAAISMWWRASERSIRGCVKSAMAIVASRGIRSVAFPIVGSGTGGYDVERALKLMMDEFQSIESNAKVVIVRYGKS